MASSSWEERAADKRSRLEAAIPAEWKIQNRPVGNSVLNFPAESGLLSAEELLITGYSASELVEKLSRGELKAVQVTVAFCKRAALAHQLVNCCVEFFPETAIAQAKELDDYFELHKKPIGPLHGLPISLKDQLRVKGYETSMGYVSWLGRYDTSESTLVALLRKSGAIFFTKTSVPQSLMVCENINNIIGRTVNPRNKNWSCGGSSGGEGALIGLRGAPLGVGTDIGGSIRVPSAFNFLYGIRPSHGRMPYAKMTNSMEGQETVHSVVGPMAHSAADLKLFFKAVLAEEPWRHDPKVVPLPWRSSEEDIARSKVEGKMTIGFYHGDGVVCPHPPVLRGIDKAISALKKAGHSVVPWDPHRHDFGHDLVNNIYTADGSVDVLSNIEASGEPVIPNIKDLLDPKKGQISLNELWDLHLKKWNYQSEYLDKWRQFEEQNGCELDAIIAPITATAAVRHDQFKYYGYASVINLLDFTSAVVPVTLAKKEVDLKRTDYHPVSDLDATVQDEYDPEAYDGAPVGLQVIGRRLSEERILVIVEEIGRLLGTS